MKTRFIGGDALFCILIDNQKDDFRYLDRDGSTNISNFDDLVSRHKGYIWPDIQEKIISQKRSPKEKEKRTFESKKASIILHYLSFILRLNFYIQIEWYYIMAYSIFRKTRCLKHETTGPNG